MRGHRPPKAAKDERETVRQLGDGFKNDTSVAKDTRRIHQIRMLCEEISQDRGSIRHVNSIPYVSEPKRNHFTFAPPREESRFRDLPELPAKATEEVPDTINQDGHLKGNDGMPPEMKIVYGPTPGTPEYWDSIAAEYPEIGINNPPVTTSKILLLTEDKSETTQQNVSEPTSPREALNLSTAQGSFMEADNTVDPNSESLSQQPEFRKEVPDHTLVQVSQTVDEDHRHSSHTEPPTGMDTEESRTWIKEMATREHITDVVIPELEFNYEVSYEENASDLVPHNVTHQADSIRHTLNTIDLTEAFLQASVTKDEKLQDLGHPKLKNYPQESTSQPIKEFDPGKQSDLERKVGMTDTKTRPNIVTQEGDASTEKDHTWQEPQGETRADNVQIESNDDPDKRVSVIPIQNQTACQGSHEQNNEQAPSPNTLSKHMLDV